MVVSVIKHVISKHVFRKRKSVPKRCLSVRQKFSYVFLSFNNEKKLKNSAWVAGGEKKMPKMPPIAALL